MRPRLVIRRAMIDACAPIEDELLEAEPTGIVGEEDRPIPGESARPGLGSVDDIGAQVLDIPEWFARLAARRAEPAEALAELAERVRGMTNPQHTVAFVNEIGRLDESGGVINELLTQELVEELRQER